MQLTPFFSRIIKGLLISFSCFAFAMSGVSAQSSDKSHPSSLADGSFLGEAETLGQNIYFYFDTGPGLIPIAVTGKTDVMNTKIHAVCSDNTGRILGEFDVAADTDGGKKQFQLRLDRKQRVNLKLTLGMEVGVKVNYQIAINGVEPPQVASSVPAAKSSETQDSSKSEDRESAALPDSQGPVEDKWALIIGISKFTKSQINLKYPAKDATDLSNYLINEGHFAADHVKLLTDEKATKESVLAEIGDKWLPRVAHPNDLVLIFISTHGSPSQLDLEGVNYLVMHNTDPDSLYATGLPLQDLATAIKQRVHSKRIVVIIDACHSGAAESSQKGITRASNVDGASLAQGTGQLVICSSKPSQISWESKRYQNGVFTHQLIEALRLGAGKQSLTKAFEEVKEKVLSEVLDDRKELQEPVLQSKWKGDDLILSAPPAKPRKAPGQ